jgi:GNAT acetyltransferase-like protein
MERLQVKEVFQLPEVKDGHIFNTSMFQSLKPGEKKYFVLTEDHRPISRIIFTFLEGKAISGVAATYGSIDFNAASVDDINFFLRQVIHKLRAEGMSEIQIRHWPSFYSKELEEMSIFEDLGFTIIHNEVNQHLRVSQERFEEKIRYNERKKLNQCINKGYRFDLLSIGSLVDVYKLVRSTRDRKGFPVSMSFDELSATILKLPETYLLFGLYDGDTLIAASVSIRITENILYNFYHADDINYRSTSPLVMLVKGIYEYCQINEIDFLDFGTSSEKGVLNEGLFKFKQNLGSDTSEKVTYKLSHG